MIYLILLPFAFILGYIIGQAFGYIRGANTYCICPNCGGNSHERK